MLVQAQAETKSRKLVEKYTAKEAKCVFSFPRDRLVRLTC